MTAPAPPRSLRCFPALLLTGALAVAVEVGVAASAEDVLMLKSGRPVRGEVVYLGDDHVRFRRVVEGARGGGSSVSDLPLSQVESIDFEPRDGEAEVLDDPAAVDTGELRRVWGRASLWLGQASSHGGGIGLAYAGRLLEDGAPAALEEAARVFALVEEGDWNPARRSLARLGKLRAWMAAGRAADALEEAGEIAEAGDDPGLLAEAVYLLASASFDELRALDEANPRWRDDDEVRPERKLLFDRVVDRFLFTFLFYGSEEEAAARGLLGACRAYGYDGRHGRAAEVARDILTHYPNTAAAGPAAAAIERFAQREGGNPGETAEDQSHENKPPPH